MRLDEVEVDLKKLLDAKCKKVVLYNLAAALQGDLR